MPRQRTTLCALIFVSLILSACTRDVVVQPTVAPTATPIAATATTAPVSPASPTAAPSATAMPTPTSVPTPTPLATPTATPATPTRAAVRPSPTPGTPVLERPRPPVYPTYPRNPGQPVAQTAHYQFFDPEGAHAATIALLAAEAEEIYAYLVARTGLEAEAIIPVVVQTQADSECAARGVAYREGRRISLFARPTTPPAQLLLILAHESAHILHMPRTNADLDVNLVEGFAHWASLRYWSDWSGATSFDDPVRGYLAEGRFLALDNPPADCTIAGRDIIYNERASFVGYLIDRYGLDAFLLASGTSVPLRRPTLAYIADYEAVYGKSLTTLLDEWVIALTSR